MASPPAFVVAVAFLLAAGCQAGQFSTARDPMPTDSAGQDRDAGTFATPSADGGMTPTPSRPDAGSQVTAPAGDCARLGAFATSAPFADGDHVSHPLPSFARGNRYYVHTLRGSSDRVLYFAERQGDGSLGGWQVASSDHGGGPHGFTAIVAGGEAYHFRNGHIARYPLGDDGVMPGDVDLREDSVERSFEGERYVWDSAVTVVLNGGSFVFHLGGFSMTPYSYRRHVMRAPVPIGGSFAGVGREHPAGRPGKSAFVGFGDHGFIFTGDSGGDHLYRARVEASGDLGDFAELANLPDGTGNGRGDLIGIGHSLVTVRGARVFVADVRSDGSITDFSHAGDLPEEQIDVHWGDGHLAGRAADVIADHLYLTGQRSVHYAPITFVGCP